ncbi:uncharacterized protein MELLADRAFT_104532 [Melampsora larici-populina 98AG31]|uniref:Uncharacterized protein n=1 Tax=Melampsora larici-populina (strain 98AG31 / pathotype 3-4-7) TaxID=747676 RepID=F4RF03_MELLP|nr:uncharacterized protein MELLADRAFT_104532 [Melampsora larici-populina 98AG31]EGG09024.1 hypothetical protein MELLADRAFT_104532 [Melampsora larici-populina 98AG31]
MITTTEIGPPPVTNGWVMPALNGAHSETGVIASCAANKVIRKNSLLKTLAAELSEAFNSLYQKQFPSNNCYICPAHMFTDTHIWKIIKNFEQLQNGTPLRLIFGSEPIKGTYSMIDSALAKWAELEDFCAYLLDSKACAEKVAISAAKREANKKANPDGSDLKWKRTTYPNKKETTKGVSRLNTVSSKDQVQYKSMSQTPIGISQSATRTVKKKVPPYAFQINHVRRTKTHVNHSKIRSAVNSLPKHDLQPQLPLSILNSNVNTLDQNVLQPRVPHSNVNSTVNSLTKEVLQPRLPQGVTNTRTHPSFNSLNVPNVESHTFGYPSIVSPSRSNLSKQPMLLNAPWNCIVSHPIPEPQMRANRENEDPFGLSHSNGFRTPNLLQNSKDPLECYVELPGQQLNGYLQDGHSVSNNSHEFLTSNTRQFQNTPEQISGVVFGDNQHFIINDQRNIPNTDELSGPQIMGQLENEHQACDHQAINNNRHETHSLLRYPQYPPHHPQAGKSWGNPNGTECQSFGFPPFAGYPESSHTPKQKYHSPTWGGHAIGTEMI